MTEQPSTTTSNDQLVQASDSAPTRRTSTERLPVAERAAIALRTALFAGVLQPGEQVKQYVWAEKLNVSRAALREGLKVLAGSRLLEHDRNRGYRVTNLSLSEMAELYWLRIAVEREVALGCKKPSVSEAEVLRDLHETRLSAYSNGNPHDIIAADRDFFFAVYDLSSRTLLLREAKRLRDLAAIYRQSAVEVALSARPERERLAKRREQQFEAVLEGDRFALAEFIVSDRRVMISYFNVEELLPGG